MDSTVTPRPNLDGGPGPPLQNFDGLRKYGSIGVTKLEPNTKKHAHLPRCAHLAACTPYLRALGGQHLDRIHDWHMSTPTIISMTVPTTSEPGQSPSSMPPG